MKKCREGLQKGHIKSRWSRWLAGILCISLVLTAFADISFVKPKQVQAEAQANKLANPRIEKDDSMAAGQKVTWDCIWFGSYPQAEVVPSSKEYAALDKELLQEGDLIKDDVLYQKLKTNTEWNEQGDIKIGGQKYRRIRKKNVVNKPIETGCYRWENETDYHYFKYQPIKWRILSVNDSEALLLADKALDIKQYHTGISTWEDSTIRGWLNGFYTSEKEVKVDYGEDSFINIAFSKADCSIIKETQVENKDNLYNGTEGGNDTIDKIFLLSESEIYTDAAKGYGFISDREVYDEARQSKSSLYAKALGIYSADLSNWMGNCWWWLRTPLDGPSNALRIGSSGKVMRNDYDEFAPYDSKR